MSTRRAQEARASAAVVPPPDRERKKSREKARGPRVRLTHFEVRRGEKLRLRIAVAEDALDEVGDELTMLLKKIAPSTSTSAHTSPSPSPPIVEAVPVHVEVDGGTSYVVEDLVISTQHDGNDETYHANLRTRLTELFNSLCDTSLTDALEIAKDVRARRAEGSN